jgi:hypothetical protein
MFVAAVAQRLERRSTTPAQRNDAAGRHHGAVHLADLEVTPNYQRPVWVHRYRGRGPVFGTFRLGQRVHADQLSACAE